MPRGKGRIGRLVDGAAILGVAVTVAGFGGGLAWWLDLFAHFRVQYAVGGILLAVAALTVGHRRTALAAVLAAAVNAAVVVPDLAHPWGARAEAGTGGRLKVATVNLYIANRNAEAVKAFLRAEAPDVIVFEEMGTFWRAALAGLADDYPYHRELQFTQTPYDSERADGDQFGLGLYSKRPWSWGRIEHFADPRLKMMLAEARLDLDGRPLTLFGVHLIRNGNPPYYRRQLAQVDRLSERVRAASADGAVVVVGDFNATPWSEPYRRLTAETRLSLGGAGFRFSWLPYVPPLALPIDHVLVGPGLAVEDKHAGPLIGSDHVPVVATVRFAS